MARVAEVRIAPAEPLGDGTAELTFELYVVGAMCCTVFNPSTSTDTFGGAPTADEIFFLVFLSLILLLINYAIFQAAEIWQLALAALVECAFKDVKTLQVVEILVFRVL